LAFPKGRRHEYIYMSIESLTYLVRGFS